MSLTLRCCPHLSTLRASTLTDRSLPPQPQFNELYSKNSKLLFAEYAKRKEKLETEQADARWVVDPRASCCLNPEIVVCIAKMRFLLNRRKKNEEAKAEAIAKRKREKEEEDTWEAGREARIGSWRDFEKKKKKKKKTGGPGLMKPPKLKTEQR